MKKGIILLFIVFCLAEIDQPDIVTKEATAAFNWLKIETGIRAIGMGGAQVAAAEGVAGVPFNPASIGHVKSSDAYVSKSNYLAGITHNVLAFGRKVTPGDFISFHLFYLDSGPMRETTVAESDGTGEMFKVLDIASSFTYARKMTDRLHLGVTLKYIMEQIKYSKAQSVAIDIGSIFNTGLWGMTLGMAVTNFGPEVRYHGEDLEFLSDEEHEDNWEKVTVKWPIPLTFRMGVKTDVIGKDSFYRKDDVHRLTLAFDGMDPVDNLTMGSVGAEYAWKESIYLRSGFHIGHDTAGGAFGAGVNIDLKSVKLILDYAFVDYDILDFTHQFGLNFKF